MKREEEPSLQRSTPFYVTRLLARFHNEVLRIEIIPRVKSIKSPNESPKVENHNKGTKIPATIEEKNIWENAWPEAAVPLIFGNSSNAAIEITGITAAIPILYNAIKPILIAGIFSKNKQNTKLDITTSNIQ